MTSASLPRPTGRDVLRHLVDGATAPLAFLLVNHQAGVRWAALVAMTVALAVALVRRVRGEPLGVVLAATAFVAVHSVSALAVGEGRAFYLPELVVNAAGLVVFALSLVAGRPLTGIVARRAGAGDVPAARHRWLTLAWTVMWASHLVPLAAFYVADSVAGLTATSTLFAKPTLIAMVAVSVVVVRRGSTTRVAEPVGSAG